MSKSMEQTINYVRDVLRKEGITGMDSINHCIVFVLCRMLDEETCKKTKIDKKYAYSNIMENDNGDELGDQELYNRVFKKKDTDCLIGQLVNKLQFKNIKFKLEGIQNLKNIMKKLEIFDPKKISSKYDIIGTIYEIHLKSGTSNAMRDLGQYYTHRLVINYMIELCDPKMEKGIIESILDPTMGTGGFLTMSIKYLNEKYKNKIDWTKNKDNIIGFDIDDNVRNMALLNVFLEMGELCEKTIVKEDTLHNDLKLDEKTILQKAKIILANEPMGLKNIVHASCCERIKNLKMRGTKAEPLFLQLFMEVLDDNGRCAVIVPDGVLFNDSTLHNETRKYMIENFDLKKIIALSDDFFLNTGVKTSILYFEKNGKKTKEIEFSNIKLNKDEIQETSIVKVKYDDLKKNKYSLFVSKYNMQEQEKIEDTEYKKIGDICSIKSGKAVNKEDRNGKKYPYFTSNGIEGYMDEYLYDGDYVILAQDGSIGACHTFNGKFYPSNHVWIISSSDEKIIKQKYLYYYLKYNVNYTPYTTGSVIPKLSKGNLESIKICVPPIDIQNKIIENIISTTKNINDCEKKIKELNDNLLSFINLNSEKVKKIKNEINMEKLKNKKKEDSSSDTEEDGEKEKKPKKIIKKEKIEKSVKK